MSKKKIIYDERIVNIVTHLIATWPLISEESKKICIDNMFDIIRKQYQLKHLKALDEKLISNMRNDFERSLSQAESTYNFSNIGTNKRRLFDANNYLLCQLDGIMTANNI